ncbi:MAG: hypothetical protein ACREAR_02250 [Nitrosotalea sp.]
MTSKTDNDKITFFILVLVTTAVSIAAITSYDRLPSCIHKWDRL